MIAIGMLFHLHNTVCQLPAVRGRCSTKRWLLWYFVFAVILAIVGNEVGWVTAEVGRQPWIVYPTITNGVLSGGLRTADAVSESIGARPRARLDHHVRRACICCYSCLWIMLLNNKIQHGPEPIL